MTKTRQEWEVIYDGTDACVTPILSFAELEKSGYDNRPAVALRGTPSYAIAQAAPAGMAEVVGQQPGVPGEGWIAKGLAPGEDGHDTLDRWLGWKENKDFEVVNGGLIKTVRASL